MELINVEDAQKLIFNQKRSFGKKKVSLLKSINHVLAENLVADRDFPPFDRVTMDGFAIKYVEGRKEYKIDGQHFAGQPKPILKPPVGTEVMTGAVLPENADTIIPYEKADFSNKKIIIEGDFFKGQNLHEKGKDKAKGTLMVPKGTTINPGIIGVAASIGKSQLWVNKKPKVYIISTGDELVDIDNKPEDYQIRKSNDISLAALLKSFGYKTKRFHLLDDFKSKELKKIIDKGNVIIMTGGVSKGKKDKVAPALKSLGVKELFHGVSQRPGKPLFCGVYKKNKMVFGLPGNPVSSLVGCAVYVMPYLELCQGKKQNIKQVILQEEVKFLPELSYFLSVRIFNNNEAFPVFGNGSGDFSHLSKVDGFLFLPKTKDTVFKKGDSYMFISLT